MQYLHYIDTALEVLGALGLLFSGLSKLPLGKTSEVFAHLGMNFLQATKAARTPAPTEAQKRITIPPKGDS